MQKPIALVHLLEELKETVTDSSVQAIPDSQAIIYLDVEDETLIIDSAECLLLLDSPATVEQFFVALNEPKNAAIELYGLSLDERVIDTLEQVFATVDEV